MHTFKDEAGTEWTLRATVASLRRVKDLSDVDPLGAIDGTLAAKVMEDPFILADILWAFVKPEAETRGVTQEQFCEQLAGDALDRATTAFLGELVSFCRHPRDRAALEAVLKATNKIMDQARDRTEAMIKTGEMEAAMQAELDRLTSGGSSTDAPASSASIPTT